MAIPENRNISGFTLVELVVVIVILGILGTVALGKFEDLGDDAENAKVDAIFGTVSSYLAKMNSMRYTLAGSPNNSTFVSIDGVTRPSAGSVLDRTDQVAEFLGQFHILRIVDRAIDQHHRVICDGLLQCR